MKCDFQQEEKALKDKIHQSKINEKRINVENTMAKIQMKD